MKRLLAGTPHRRRHPGVIGDRLRCPAWSRNSATVVGVAAGAAVDDRRQAIGLAQAVQQRAALARHRALALHRHHVEGEVGPVKARAHRHGVAEVQALGDLAGHARGSGGGGRHHRRASEVGDRVVQAQVVGTEVVPPLGHAVGLVDHEQRHPSRRERLAKGTRGKALGRGQDQLGAAGPQVAQRVGGCGRRPSRRRA